ncbi:MAG: DUF3465 domain-containing protein [Actinomycetes bacterium]
MTARGPRARASATLLVAVAVPALALALAGCGGPASGGAAPGGGTPGAGSVRGDAALAAASRDHAHDRRVQGSGVVIRVLPDDTEGGRHQRFILRLASGQTLLVAHNIDIAPRVPDLKVGDTVAFEGAYEWNAEGGTIHWTHHDPGGSHVPGWLRRDGQTYE